MRKERSFPEPQWVKGAVFYQIYPRSFKDTNGDGIGDIQGIIQKLDYLNGETKDSLGVDAIWLSPVYRSPMKDFGYDVSDYYSIDPLFGSMDDFELLLREAHKRNIKVVLDFIPNHTSDEHPWFLESRSCLDNPKRDWYVWHDPGVNGGPPNNWISKTGESAWTLDETTGQYYLHKYLPEQPDLNWRNREVQKEMERVMRFWLEKGIDGFRVDAINQLVEDGDFRDNPVNPDYVVGRDNPYDRLLHIYTRNRPENIGAVDMFCRVLSEYKDVYMVSEAHVDPEDMIKIYHACPQGVISPFNFNLINLPWNAREYKNFIDNFEKVLHGTHWPNYVLGNHDLPRLITRLGIERARLAAVMLLTLRGTPFIYYGDEIGIENVLIDSEHVRDPLAHRLPMFHLGRDPERSPMQWDSSTYAGFSHVKPWLPVEDSYKERNVEKELNDPDSFLSLYRDLISLRKSRGALRVGRYQSLKGSEEVFVYMRFLDGEHILVVLNFSSNPCSIQIPEAKNGKIIGGTSFQRIGETIDVADIPLGPHEGVIVEL